MAMLSGTVIFRGQERRVRPTYELGIIPKLNEVLRLEEDWYLSVDPSTTCTGLFMVNKKETIFLALDYERSGSDKYEFKRGLQAIISGLVRDLSMKMVIMEKPLEHGYKNAAKALFEFRGMLKDMMYDVPELKDIPINDIHPMTWKSAMIDRDKGKNRHKDKRKTAEDIVDKYPQFKGHLERCQSDDLDSFDAIGVLYGYFAKRTDENGDSVNFGEIEPSHISLVVAHYLPVEQMEMKNYHSLFSKFSIKLRKAGVVKTNYNKDYSFYKNIKFASTQDKIVMLPVDDLAITINLCWELDVNYEPNKRWMLVVLRANKGTSAEMKTITRNYTTFKVY
ncbi:hypothetical protein UT300012_22760 [Paraclostridium bifermentans]